MKAIGKLSTGCMAFALALQGFTFAANHSVVPVITITNTVVGQAMNDSDSARRRNADKSLTQAREALEAGKLDWAESYVAQAEGKR